MVPGSPESPFVRIEYWQRQMIIPAGRGEYAILLDRGTYTIFRLESRFVLRYITILFTSNLNISTRMVAAIIKDGLE